MFQVAQDKLKSKTNDKTPPGTSPFTARRLVQNWVFIHIYNIIYSRSETEVFTSKRRSFFTGEATPQIEEKSPDDGEGGSDDVVKRTKTGIGLGGDILAEMRVKQEKRASVIPKTSDIGNAENRMESKEEENPFGGIKLRWVKIGIVLPLMECREVCIDWTELISLHFLFWDPTLCQKIIFSFVILLCR